MSRKSKIDPSIKVKVIEDYLNGKLSLSSAARTAGVRDSTVRKWIAIYQNEGPTGLLDQPKNKVYSNEFKLQAVLECLNGGASIAATAKKYGLRSKTQLTNWIKKYNAHEEFSSRRFSGGGGYMSNARKTSFEERKEIVQFCLGHGKNYGLAAQQYNCSYQQVRSWVLKYEKMGISGLEDRRGKRTLSQSSRTQEEELRKRIAELEWKNQTLQMENDLLKKVKELERRRGSR